MPCKGSPKADSERRRQEDRKDGKHRKNRKKNREDRKERRKKKGEAKPLHEGK